jgi:hypothetical protein
MTSIIIIMMIIEYEEVASKVTNKATKGCAVKE